MDAVAEIEVLIRARYPVLYIVTWEERRVEAAVSSVCQNLKRTLHSWSVTQGMKPVVNRTTGPANPTPIAAELEALVQVQESAEYTVFLLKDFHAFLKDYRVVRLLRDIATKLRGRAQTLVLVGPTLSLPPELEKDISVVEFPLPDSQEIEAKLDQIVLAIQGDTKLNTELKSEERERLVKSAQGLTLDEVENVLARSLVEHRKFDIDAVLEEKKQIVRKSGLLEYYPANVKMSDVGGLELLKEWLSVRDAAFTEKAKDFGIPVPKGILILGVQGCGKSLVAKAVAGAWQLPMLKMDVGRIFGSLVGQSEENMRRAIRIAESVAPCILWMDELEKGFSGTQSSGVSDGGTTARVFSTFLTWMQEKTKAVFLIATANDVTKLPPELLRKGRFDETFFVDLPDKQERKDIFQIHLSKRKRDPAKFDVEALATQTKGYSGAEIEMAVVGGLMKAFSEKRELETRDIEEEVKATRPLSVMMDDEIAELRDWAAERTRPTSKNDGD